MYIYLLIFVMIMYIISTLYFFVGFFLNKIFPLKKIRGETGWITYCSLESMDHILQITHSLSGLWTRRYQLLQSGCSTVLSHDGCRNWLCSLHLFLVCSRSSYAISSNKQISIGSISVFISKLE